MLIVATIFSVSISLNSGTFSRVRYGIYWIALRLLVINLVLFFSDSDQLKCEVNQNALSILTSFFLHDLKDSIIYFPLIVPFPIISLNICLSKAGHVLSQFSFQFPIVELHSSSISRFPSRLSFPLSFLHLHNFLNCAWQLGSTGNVC